MGQPVENRWRQVGVPSTDFANQEGLAPELTQPLLGCGLKAVENANDLVSMHKGELAHVLGFKPRLLAGEGRNFALQRLWHCPTSRFRARDAFSHRPVKNGLAYRCGRV